MKKYVVLSIAFVVMAVILGWGLYGYFSPSGAVPQRRDFAVVTVQTPSDAAARENAAAKGAIESGTQSGQPLPSVEINFNLNQVLQENGTRKDIRGAEQSGSHTTGLSLWETLLVALALGLLLVGQVYLCRKKQSGQ